MTETLGPMSDLDAVNQMLNSIGEASITSLTGTLAPDAATALKLLYAASRDLQEEGYHFNTEYEVQLTPDGSGFLDVGSDVLRISNWDSKYDCTERDTRLYDRKNNTFVWTTNYPELLTTPFEVTLVRHLAFTDLPHVVRRYVTALAIEQFHAAFPPPQEFVQRAEQNFVRARDAFEQAEGRNSHFNMLSGSRTIRKILNDRIGGIYGVRR